MKKTLKALFVILVFGLSMMFAVSCDTEENDGSPAPLEGEALAFDIINKSDEKMDAIESYTTDINMLIELKQNDVTMVTNITGKQAVMGENTDDFFYEENFNYQLTVDGIKSSYTTRHGYQRGTIFYIYHDNQNNIKEFRSSINQQDFIEYKINSNDSVNDDSIDISNCTADAQKGENGDWQITISSFDEAAIAEIKKLFGDEILPPDVTLTDVVFTLDITPEFYYKAVYCEFIFEGADNSDIPKLSLDLKFSELNTTVITVADLSKCTEIADVSVMNKFISELNAIKNKEHGSFNLTIKQTDTYKGKVGTYEETDRGIYGTINGGFVYDVKASYAGETYNLTYEKGTRRLGNYRNYKSDDKTERAFIRRLLDYAEFDFLLIKGMEKTETEGVYIFTLSPSNSLIEALKPGQNYSYVRSTVTVTATFSGNTLVKYDCYIDATYQITSGNSSYEYSRKITTSCEYS